MINAFLVRFRQSAVLLSLLVVGVRAQAQTFVVQVAVDAGHPMATVSQNMLGINTAGWDSELGSQNLAALLAKTNLQSLRYPGGSWADEFDWTKPKVVGTPMTKDFVRTVEAVHGDGIVTLNYGTGTPQMGAAWAAYCDSSPKSLAVIGTDSAGTDWKTAGYWAKLRAATPLTVDDGLNTLRASHPLPLPIHLFEVGNECYGSWETDKHSPKHDAVEYAQFFAQTYNLIKQVAPGAMVGAVITGDEHSGGDNQESVINPVSGQSFTGWTPIVLSTLRGSNISPDFVIFHNYAQEPGHESDVSLLQDASRWGIMAREIRSMLTDYLPANSTKISLYCTENNSVSYNPGKQSTSLVNGLYLADSFGAILQTEFQGFYWWCLYNSTSEQFNNSPQLYGWRNYGDYGILSAGQPEPQTPNDTPYPTFRAFELIGHFCDPGDRVLTSSTDNALVSAYAVRKKNKSLTLLLINKSPSAAAAANIQITGFKPKALLTAWSYGILQDSAASQGEPSDISQSTAATASQLFTYSLPPYSMTVLVISGKR